MYKGTPRTNTTRDAQRYAVQHKATRAKRNPNNVTAVVVCCWQIKQVRTVDLTTWEWVEENLYTVFFEII